MSKKREIFRLIDRDCVSSVTSDAIKTYINNLLQQKGEKK